MKPAALTTVANGSWRSAQAKGADKRAQGIAGMRLSCATGEFPLSIVVSRCSINWFLGTRSNTDARFRNT